MLISTSQRGRYSRCTKRKQAREVTKPEEGGKLNSGWARIEIPVWLGSRHCVTLPFRRTCSAFKEVTQRNWNNITVQRIQFQILTPSFVCVLAKLLNFWVHFLTCNMGPMISSFIQKNIMEHVFLKEFFDVDHFLKSLLNLLQCCFFFFFNHWLIVHETCEILAPQPGIEPALLALEGKILTTGPWGKSLWSTFYMLTTVLGSEGTASGR